MSQTIVPLSNSEVRAVTSRAETKYKSSLGKRPTIKDVSMGYNSTHNLTAVHVFAIVVAVLMFLVTLVKVWEHQSLLVTESYAHWTNLIVAQGYTLETIPGFVLHQDLVVKIYQLSFSLATEVSMILFLVWFQTTPRRKLESWYDIGGLFQYLPLVVSLMAMFYVIIVNLNSGGFWLTNLLPPLATFSVSFLFEDMLTKRQQLRNELLTLLRPRQAEWDNRVRHMKTDRDYLEFEMWELIDALIRVKRNNSYPNAWMRDADQSEVIAAARAQRTRMTEIAMAAWNESELLNAESAKAEPEDVPDIRLSPPNGEYWTPIELADAMKMNGWQEYNIKQMKGVANNIAAANKLHPTLWQDTLKILGRA